MSILNLLPDAKVEDLRAELEVNLLGPMLFCRRAIPGMLERRRYATTGLWFNHLAAAFDAMRAARIHNFPLRQNMRIEVKTAWRSGSPAVRASVERSF